MGKAFSKPTNKTKSVKTGKSIKGAPGANHGTSSNALFKHTSKNG